MNGLKNGLQEGLTSGLNNGLAEGLTNGLTNGLFVNEYSFDIDANKFLLATNINDIRIKNAINKLVINLKAANIWTKMKAVYPMVGGTATAHKFNLKNPADTDSAFRLNFVGGWTHSATGALPNGTNAYADTFLIPNSVTTLNSIGLSFYSRTDLNLNNKVDIGCWDGAGFNYTLMYLKSNGNSFCFLQTTTITGQATFADTNSLGFYLSTRTANNLTKIYKNGVSKATSSVLSTGQPSVRSIYIGASNGNTLNYSSRECAFASIGNGLTDAEALTYYNAVQTFQTTLGRQV